MQVFLEDVVAVHGPVEHDAAVGQQAVGKHHLLAPELLALAVYASAVVRKRILAAAAVILNVIAVRLRDHHRVIELLDSEHVSHILLGLEIVQRLRSDRAGDVAKLGAVDEYARLDAGAVGKAEFPGTAAAFDRGDGGAETQIRSGSGRHVLKYLRSHAGIEHDLRHPARIEGVVASVTCCKRVAELSEDAAPQAVVAVNGAHSGAREHASEPWALFDYYGACPEARGLDSSGSAAGPAAHYGDVVFLRAGY